MDGGAAKPSRFTPIAWDDICASLDAEWIIKGILPRRGLGMIFGATGSGKTFKTLDMSGHAALGHIWHGRKVEPVGVVYLAPEGGNGIANRVEAFKRKHAPTIGDVPFMVLRTGLDLRSRNGDTDEIIKMIKAVPFPVGLIPIDTLSAAMAGGEENTSEDMGAYVMNTSRIAEATGAFVLSVHHCGKDEAKGARGHSLLKAAMDFEAEVVNSDGVRTMTVTKMREGETGQTFAFKLEKVQLGEDRDGDAVTSCVCVPIEGTVAVVPQKSERKQKPLSDRAITALDKLKDLIARTGQPAPASDYIPSGKQVVKVDAWRDHLKMTGVISDDPTKSTSRTAFYDIKEALVAAGRIAIWGQHVWLV